MTQAAGRLLGLPRTWTLALLPLLVIAAARLAAHSPLASAYPRAAALILVWIVADSLMLALMTRARPGGPERAAVLATLAASMVCAFVVMPAHLRTGLLSMPVILGLMGLPVAAHLLWGTARARRAWSRARASREDAPLAAAGELLPPALARFAVAEARLLHLALFRWGAAPDVPAGAAAFGYHRHLVPIVSVVLTLQAIEIGAMHLLVGLWSATGALILSIVSLLALIYMVGLVKSFRLRPVLVDRHCLRVRSGILIDKSIAIDNIAAVRTAFASEEVKRAGCVQAGLLAWPNILIELRHPVPDPGPFRPDRVMDSIAFRLDEPDAFVRLLRERIAER